MPTFAYQSLTTGGQERSGTITAMDRADAVRQLIGRGETATNVVPVEEAGRIRPQRRAAKPRPRPTTNGQAGDAAKVRAASFSLASLSGGRPRLRRAEMASLVRELATALEAGLPLMQALKTVRRQASGPAMPVILDHFIERVEAGDQLHQAARDYGPPFDDLIVGMLRAADASGKVSEVLHQLADLLERSLELRREVLGATFYPMIVAVLIACSAVILVTVLVPQLIEPLAGQITLPWPTRVVLGFASFLGAYWIYVFVAIALVWFAWRAWSRTPGNRYRIDLFKLRAPLLGRLLRDVAVARFTRTLGTLTSAGLPILESLRITQKTLGNAAMEEAMEAVQDQVTHGKALADPLERSGLFPPLLIQVVNLGERSGRLESMLLHAATAFDRQVNTSIKLFTKALPPLLLIVMASLGGFVLAAILLPLLELQSLVK
jgi:type II secretory pathway component PulF